MKKASRIYDHIAPFCGNAMQCNMLFNPSKYSLTRFRQYE